MVVQRTIDNLRQRPKEDRRALASGIAIGVAVLVFFAWVYIFARTFNPTPLTEGAQKAYTAASNAADSAGDIQVNGVQVTQ